MELKKRMFRLLRTTLQNPLIQKIEKGFKFKPKTKGKIGEFKIDLYLQELTDFEHVLLHDILLKYKDHFSQIDHILVTKYGVFVIETKNYTGQIEGNEHDEKWKQHIHGQVFEFYNPIKQNAKHIYVLKQVLENEFPDLKIPFYSVIVFVGDANIDRIKTDTAVLHVQDIVRYFSDFKTKHLTGQDLWFIVDVIKGLKK